MSRFVAVNSRNSVFCANVSIASMKVSDVLYQIHRSAQRWKPSAQSLGTHVSKSGHPSSVLGKRPRHRTKTSEFQPRNEGSIPYRNVKNEFYGGGGTTNTGFSTERRRMSVEFAAMRREEQGMFPSATSKPAKRSARQNPQTRAGVRDELKTLLQERKNRLNAPERTTKKK